VPLEFEANDKNIGGERTAKDPVCGMDVDERTARYKTTQMGRTYYFCSPGCRRAFEADPDRYLKK